MSRSSAFTGNAEPDFDVPGSDFGKSLGDTSPRRKEKPNLQLSSVSVRAVATLNS